MANDFAYQKVSTAEEAIVVLRAFTDRQSRRQSKVKQVKAMCLSGAILITKRQQVKKSRRN